MICLVFCEIYESIACKCSPMADLLSTQVTFTCTFAFTLTFLISAPSTPLHPSPSHAHFPKTITIHPIPFHYHMPTPTIIHPINHPFINNLSSPQNPETSLFFPFRTIYLIHQTPYLYLQYIYLYLCFTFPWHDVMWCDITDRPFSIFYISDSVFLTLNCERWL